MKKTFAVVLFERIDRPQFKARLVSVDELAALLTRFEVLPDKHLGRCWSPTKVRRRQRAGLRLRSSASRSEEA